MVVSYCNNINTVEGGTHLTGFRTALTRTLNNYAKSAAPAKNKDLAITGEDFKEGLTAIVSVRVPDPQFEGQTKTKLGNGEVEGIVSKVVNDKLAEFLEKNPAAAKKVIAKAQTGGRGPRGGAEVARAGPQPQGGALRRRPARQADGLHHPRPGLQRAVPRRGRQRRRDRRGGPRPELPGDPAAAGQDPQRRARPARPGARQRRGPQHHHGRRQRHRRGRRPRQAAVRQGRDDERRRRRRVAHPDPADDLLLPPDAPPRGRGAPVRGPAPALPGQPQEGPAVRPDRHRRCRRSWSSAGWRTPGSTPAGSDDETEGFGGDRLRALHDVVTAVDHALRAFGRRNLPLRAFLARAHPASATRSSTACCRSTSSRTAPASTGSTPPRNSNRTARPTPRPAARRPSRGRAERRGPARHRRPRGRAGRAWPT